MEYDYCAGQITVWWKWSSSNKLARIWSSNGDYPISFCNFQRINRQLEDAEDATESTVLALPDVENC